MQISARSHRSRQMICPKYTNMRVQLKILRKSTLYPILNSYIKIFAYNFFLI